MLNEFDLEDFDILEPICIVDVPKNSYVKYFGDIFKYFGSDGLHAECEDIISGRQVFLKTWAMVYPLKHKDMDKPIPFKL
jgi:hypothetical protein